MKTLIKEYNVYTNKNINIKFAVVGDIHGYFSKKSFSSYINKLNSIDKDIIFILGDICQGKNWQKEKSYNKLYNFLTSISSKVPVVLILGNHDLFGFNDTALSNYKKLSNIKNVYPLYNENLDLTIKNEKIHITGLISEFGTYITSLNNLKTKVRKKSNERINRIIDSITKLNSNLDSDSLNILLAHDPRQMRIKEVYNEAKKYDIILSAHVHNGYIINCISDNKSKLVRDLDWLHFLSFGIAKKRTYSRGIIYGSEENYILNLKDTWFRYNKKYKLISKEEALSSINNLTPIVITGGVNKFAGLPIDSSEILLVNIKKNNGN